MNSQKNTLDNNYEFSKKKILRNGDWAEFEYMGRYGIEKVTGWVEFFVIEDEETKQIRFEEPQGEIEVDYLLNNDHNYTKILVHTVDNQTITLHFNHDEERPLVDITPLEPTLTSEDYNALVDLALFLKNKEMFMYYVKHARKDVVK